MLTIFAHARRLKNEVRFRTFGDDLGSGRGECFYGEDLGNGRGESTRKTAQTMLTIFAHARRLKNEVRFRTFGDDLGNLGSGRGENPGKTAQTMLTD